MSRKVDLPNEDQVRQTMAALIEEALADGTRPTVLDLARHLNLTNTTFWRHFPEIAEELRTVVRNRTADGSTSTGRPSELERENANLRRANQQLTEHLDLAIANIQRLSLDNHRLLEEVEAAAKITRLDTKARNR